MHQGQTCYDKSPSVAYLALRRMAVQAGLGGPVASPARKRVELGEGAREVERRYSPLAVVHLEAGEVKVHDFALELQGLRQGICRNDGGRCHGHGLGSG